MKTYTEEAEALAVELDIEVSVAMDILFLRTYEKRIIILAKANKNIRDFPVENQELEDFLTSVENKLCFSCDRKTYKYITGLCEDCHRVAMKAE